MEEDKKPVHGQIRVDEDGRAWVYVEENKPGNPVKEMTISPDSIRDKELEDLRHKLRRAKCTTWLLFVLGITLGALISLALKALWW